MIDLPGYMTPEEGAAADAGMTDRSLGATLAMMRILLAEKATLARRKWEDGVDAEELAYIKERMKDIRDEESSLHRIASGFQSRLKVAAI